MHGTALLRAPLQHNRRLTRRRLNGRRGCITDTLIPAIPMFGEDGQSFAQNRDARRSADPIALSHCHGSAPPAKRVSYLRTHSREVP
jgi:hypothetical protein